MSNEELMRPRYKVVADYPRPKNHPYFEVGYVSNAITREDIDYFEKFPHLFKKLEWYDERKIEEMPEYIKFTNSGRVFKISKWSKCIGGWNMHNEVDGKDVTDCYASIEWHFQKEKSAPATATEYERYINQKEKQ